MKMTLELNNVSTHVGYSAKIRWLLLLGCELHNLFYCLNICGSNSYIFLLFQHIAQQT